MYDFSVPFLRTNASFEIIARERQPIRWPCCVVPWTSTADWSKDKSLGPLDVEGEKGARSWVSPLKPCSAAETLAIVLGTHFSKREWNISPSSMSQLILRVFLNSEQISVFLLLWDHGKGWRWRLTSEHNSPSPQPIPANDSHLEQEDQTRPHRETSPPLMVSPFISLLNRKLACTLTGPFTATYSFWGNLFLIYFGESVSCIPGWSQTGDVAEDNLELLILQLPPPEYRPTPPLMVFKVLEMEPRGLCRLGKHPSRWDTSPACPGRGKCLKPLWWKWGAHTWLDGPFLKVCVALLFQTLRDSMN